MNIIYITLYLFSFVVFSPTYAHSNVLDLGVMAPNSTTRGTVATQDSKGNKVVLVWLHDIRSAHGLLVIYPKNGATKFFPTPKVITPPSSITTPYASILSRKNRYYTHFGNYFIEFDVESMKFTKVQKTSTSTAMSMTESDDGIIWSATYPQAGLVSYNPNSKEFTDYGVINKETWPQYPRAIATDDKGYVYVGIGFTRAIAVAIDPRAKKVLKVFSHMPTSTANYVSVTRGTDGKVYGPTPDGNSWLTFYEGRNQKTLKKEPSLSKVSYIAGNQGLFHKDFKDGSKISSLSLTDRVLTVVDRNGKSTRVKFDYKSEGAMILNLVITPAGRIIGGTAFPFSIFDYNVTTKEKLMRGSPVQFNALNFAEDRVFVGGYTKGTISTYDVKEKQFKIQVANSNKVDDSGSEVVINRPMKILVDPSIKSVVMSGTPDYGKTGGGLHFWNYKTNKSELLNDVQIIKNQSTSSMYFLTTKLLLGGTTVAPGTGGQILAKEAVLYLMSRQSKEILWKGAVIPGAKTYNDLIVSKNGKIFGIADRRIFFVFDWKTRKIISQKDVSKQFGLTASSESQRVFLVGSCGDDERIYVLFKNKIARIDTNKNDLISLALIPQGITAPGAIHNGIIYFASGSHLYSYDSQCK